jgi:hypothetical protein
MILNFSDYCFLKFPSPCTSQKLFSKEKTEKKKARTKWPIAGYGVL